MPCQPASGRPVSWSAAARSVPRADATSGCARSCGVLDGVEVREGGLGAATQDLGRGHQHPGPQVAGAEAPAVARRAGDRGPGVGAGPRPVPAQGPREAQGALGLHRQVRPVVALGQGERLGGVAAGLVGLAVHQPAGARHERQGPQRGALHDLRPDRPGGGPRRRRASPGEGGPDGDGPPEDGDVVALIAGRSGPGGGERARRPVRGRRSRGPRGPGGDRPADRRRPRSAARSARGR